MQTYTLVEKDAAGEVIGRILGEVKPSAAHFTEQDGHRGATLAVDVREAARIPALAEPFFVPLGATGKVRICMTAEDLGQAGFHGEAP